MTILYDHSSQSASKPIPPGLIGEATFLGGPRIDAGIRHWRMDRLCSQVQALASAGAAEMTDSSSPNSDFRKAWHGYYSEKRIAHQWLQVELLQDLPIRRVLEIGPYLGLVTAMMASAGYAVTTLDIEAQSHGVGSERHVQADIRNADPAVIQGFDAILCCETLEHIHWQKLDSVLRRIAAAGAPWLIVSVPYEGLQFAFELYFNRQRWRRRSHFRKFRFLQRFTIQSDTEWEAHKWEIGYRGHSLKAFVRKIEAAGFEITKREFTSGCRSVFFVCRNGTAAVRS